MNTPPPPGGAPQPIDEALALHRAGKHELAMQRYVAILQQNPGHADALYYVAVLALQQGQIDEGLKVIARAIQVVGAPQARLHNLKGQAHLRQNRDDEAFDSFSRAIVADPSFPDAYGNRATLLAEMGKLEEAVADYDRALALRPFNTEDICNRAGVLADIGRLDEAVAGFDRALALMPEMAPAYYNRGNLYMRVGQPASALADFDKALAIAPNVAEPHAGRGRALEALQRKDEAKASFTRAAELDPKYAELADED